MIDFITVGKLKDILKDVPDEYLIEYLSDYYSENATFCEVDNSSKSVQLGSV